MEHFLTTLHSGQNVMSSARNDHQQPLSPEEEMRRQIDEFNRSVTIVIWYQANTEPIRLHQMLPTFPYFQLSCCGDLINDLGLSFSSYLDAWIPSSCQWEQQTITVVRIVESQQRLLYKVRRRLTDPLPDSDCLSLHEELQLQAGNLEARARSLQNSGPNSSTSSSLSSPSKSRPLSMNEPGVGQNKRVLKASTPTADVHESGSSPKTQLMNGYYMPHPSPNIVSGVEDSSPQNGDRQINGGDDGNMFVFQNMFYSQQPPQQQANDNGLPQYLLAPTTSAAPIPYITHPPLKRWPNDYTVAEIAAGFTSIDLLIAHNAPTGGITQRQAFERVFGCRYVKSTVCRHRAVWRKANPALKDQYEAMGSDERACWGEFVRRVEGRSPGKGGSNSDAMMSPSPTTTIGYQSGEEEDVHGQEGVMTLSQSQVAGPSNPNPVSSSTIVFDTSRNRLGGGSHTN